MKEGGVSEVAFIGLGSNLGDALQNVRDALDNISRLQSVDMIATSSFYKSDPIGIVDQPDFVNAVCKVSVSIGPDTLLQYLLNIEKIFGRVRTVRNGPRIIDLDVLLFGEMRYSSSDICIPHPRMFERAFVLKPLLEIAPEIRFSKNFVSSNSIELIAGESVTKI
ncbi:MAG: 2-amino-4-hydroxy-6-hydroxymethyldihydropteridine diphosphokinase [Proteobacteria bacterium]|nr:2-amino-4-hydroxy-6-hydroxymethyldihydropteridine diphosphokinase [Pseudomonadota bacterium]MDA1331237.1 2-amino-4-hydroxy-6-hydroxymethyldihydropteridine diphosphokinase [Pseudomonadota bacterium]